MSMVAPQMIASHPAATTVMSPDDIEQKMKISGLPTYTREEKQADQQELIEGVVDMGTVKELGASFLDGGVPVGSISAPLGVVSSLFTRNLFSKRELSQLTDKYRGVIAQKMGVAEEAVDESTLKACAERDPELAAALVHVAEKREAHVAVNASGLGGMMAGAAAGATAGSVVPVVGNFIGGMAGGMLGYMAGEDIGKSVLDVTDASDPAAILEAIEEKKNNGQYISAEDVFALKLAQHPQVRKNVVARHGANFGDMDETTRKEVMHGLPALAQQAARDAVLCNFPEAQVDQLIAGDLAPQAANFNAAPPAYANQPTGWVSRVMDEPSRQMQAPRKIGFAEAVLRGRENIAVGPNAANL
jgi:hypothetical protein